MWIAAQFGFFSIVHKEYCWHVRARVRRDLENLVALAGLDHVEVETWPEADYRWRIRIAQKQLEKVFKTLEKSIDYPNFKSRIVARSDQSAKSSTYGAFWSDMMRIQLEEEHLVA